MLFSLLVTGILIIACISDVTSFRIPNALSLAIIAVFVVKVTAMTDIAVWPGHVIAALLVLAMTFAAFGFGLMGGGDAKLMTALALWFGMTDLPSFLAMTAMGGGVVAISLLVLRALISRPALASSRGGVDRPRLLDRKAPVPYALPISLAALWLEWF